MGHSLTGDAAMELVIGDKLYSTWSLRPWLVLKRCGADFIETVIRALLKEFSS